MRKIEDYPIIFNYEHSPIEWIVPGIIPSAGVTGITGASGSGKSTLVCAIAGHVAAGVDFLGRRCIQRKVLILDRENTIAVTQERLKRLGISDPNFRVLLRGSKDYPVPNPWDKNVLDFVEENDPKPLIVIDNLREFLIGDENDSASMRNFMSKLRELAFAGAGVIIIHHTGKGGGPYRGSCTFPADLEAGYVLTNVVKTGLEKLEMTLFKPRIEVDRKVIVHSRDLPLPQDGRGRLESRDAPSFATDDVPDFPITVPDFTEYGDDGPVFFVN